MHTLDLDADDFGPFFSDHAMRAGLEYADEQRVEDVRVTRTSEDEVLITAAVHGTARTAYRTIVHLYLDGWGNEVEDLDSVCTCPVRFDCKHGAAVCWSVRDPEPGAPASAAPSQPGWQRDLASLVRAVSFLEEPPSEPIPVALRLTWHAARTSYGTTVPASLRVRPVRLGARGKWIKSGIGWDELLRGPGGYGRAQTAALADLARSRESGTYYWERDEEPVAHAFGPQFIPLLRAALAAGVELDLQKPITSLRLHERPFDLEITASADATATSIEVDVVSAPDPDSGQVERWGLTDTTFWGSPAHAVARLVEGQVEIAPLVRRIPLNAVEALKKTAAVQLPPDAEALPALRRLQRSVALFSPDDSVPLPEPLRPSLVLTVQWKTAHEAHLNWSWRYGEDEIALDAADPVRDRGAEKELLARLPQPLGDTFRVVSGVDTLHLALLELPLWRACDDVEVVEVDAPDFREAEEAPDIRFETVESEHTDWLDLEVLITVDGHRVPLADVLAALTRGEEHLVLASGLFVRTDRPEFAQLDDLVRAAGELHEREGDTVRVGHHDLGVLAQLAEVGIVAGQAAEWAAKAQRLRDVVELPDPEPVGVVSTLRHYQRDGFRWLAFLWEHGLGGILADDMGLGKTLQVLSLIAHTRARTDAPFLVVAPTSVVGNWAIEAAQHTPGLVVRTVAATRKKRQESIEEIADGADVVVTSFTLLRLEGEAYERVGWEGVVLDEAQQVKNHRSQAYGVIRRIPAPFRLAVTGTPFENRLKEMWALLSIVTPGIYPQLQRFGENVATPVEKRGDAAALRRFTTRIKPFVLRRTKEMVALDLPPKQEQLLPVELGPRHRKLYDTHLTRERQKILALLDDFAGNQIAILAALTRLRQMALDPALVDDQYDRVGSAKLDVLTEHVAELVAEGHQALVFSSFTGFLDRAEERLRDLDIPFARLDGSTTNRAKVIERFRSGEGRVFLISLKAGGVGLTLTEADYVFVLDPWWNPAAEAQAVDRAHRIGQDKTVLVYRLVSTDTIEDKVMELKERKLKLFQQVIDGEGAMSTKLSADDIRGLFT